MVQTLLTDEIWKKLAPLMAGKAGDPGRSGVDNRLFFEAVWETCHTGRAWCNLPPEYGQWRTVYMRFARWRRSGVWKRIADALAGEIEMDCILNRPIETRPRRTANRVANGTATANIIDAD